MPANYAHFRFGKAAINTLPVQLRKPIQRFQRIYDVGQHGPDLFFHYNIFWNTAPGQLGNTFHAQTGREFFTRACQTLKENPSEAATAYLYGLLGHYCLDAVCHPYVQDISDSGKARHTELEIDFDRHLLRLDGKLPPHTQNLGAHLKLTRGECVTVAGFYPPATPAQVSHAIKRMARHSRILAARKRGLLEFLLKATSETVRDHLMPTRANPRCEGLHPELLRLYQEALARYPLLAAQLQAHLDTGEPLGADFDATFG